MEQHPTADIFVSVKADEINNNNLQKYNPYTFTELDGSNYNLRTQLSPGKPECGLCMRIFPTWSILYQHKARNCFEEEIPEAQRHLVQVHFPKNQLQYIEDALKSLGKEVKIGKDDLFVEQEAQHLTIFLRQLYTAQITKYNIERWYNSLDKASSHFGKEITDKTIFLPLSDEDLKLIQALCSVRLASNIGVEVRKSNKELEGEEKMEERLASVMDPKKSYFCKFSTRSPKDGVSLNEEEKKLDILSRLKRKMNLLKVSEPSQVLELLSRSQRIFSDISFYFQYRVLNSSSSELSIILREWNDGIDPSQEFRCFVHNKKMTAISQYQCYSVFPNLQNEDYVNRVKAQILKFHSDINEFIEVEDYVIDIAILPDFSCHVIELNPFGAWMSSGAALYNWEKDFDILYGIGQNDVPIRIAKEVIDKKE